MKKIILSSVVAAAAAVSVSAPVQAAANTTAICAASTTATSSTATIALTGFIKTVFTPKCSANVYLTGDDQTSYYGAGAASLKGKNVFQGSTAGGGVRASTTCASATGCTATEADTAATTAPSS